MPGDEVKDVLEKIREDLATIKVYQKFLAKDNIEATLNKVASTPDRQQMWRLADGTLSNDQIADKVGVTLRTVQYFVEDAEKAELLTTIKRGYPKRIVELVPAEWKPWKPKKATEQPQPQQAPGNEKTEVA
jgi:hypothetical protein